jgi:hypothetical protein
MNIMLLPAKNTSLRLYYITLRMRYAIPFTSNADGKVTISCGDIFGVAPISRINWMLRCFSKRSASWDISTFRRREHWRLVDCNRGSSPLRSSRSRAGRQVNGGDGKRKMGWRGVQDGTEKDEIGLKDESWQEGLKPRFSEEKEVAAMR